MNTSFRTHAKSSELLETIHSDGKKIIEERHRKFCFSFSTVYTHRVAKYVPLVRLELTTSASLFVYKYSALTDCATGADGGDRYKSTLIANTHGHTLTRRANEPRSPF